LSVRLLDQLRDLGLARDADLAKAAARDPDAVLLLFGRSDDRIRIRLAFVFVVAFRCDGVHRASNRTGLAGLVEIVKAVGPVMRVGLG